MTSRLLKALESVLDNAGNTVHKPAGQKPYNARVIPFELFAELEAAYLELNRDLPSDDDTETFPGTIKPIAGPRVQIPVKKIPR